MQLKTGIDIVYIPKIEKIIENKAINKIFSKKELKIPTPQHLAGIFALKEAFFKALKIKPKWLAIEVTNKRNGAPKINISKELNINPIDISYSISHDNKYAIANVNILTK
jgi:phosphopantetheine--protein transferase-like protein